MIKAISSQVLIIASLMSFVLAQDTMMVAWSGTPGYLESTIMGDTLADGTQAHDVYLLESNKVYLQLSEINLYSSCEIAGAAYGEGEHPATIQPIGGSEGTSQFTGWPQNNFKTYGMHQTYKFHNLLMNGVYALDSVLSPSEINETPLTPISEKSSKIFNASLILSAGLS